MGISPRRTRPAAFRRWRSGMHPIQWGEKIPAQETQSADALRIEAVAGMFARNRPLHQPRRFQLAEVLRNGGLRQGQDFHDFAAHTCPMFCQCLKYGDPGRMCQRSIEQGQSCLGFRKGFDFGSRHFCSYRSSQIYDIINSRTKFHRTFTMKFGLIHAQPSDTGPKASSNPAFRN